MVSISDGRSTLTPDRRLERVMGYLEHDLQRRVEPGDVLPTQRSWRHWHGLAPLEFRRSVYNQNLWLSSLLSVGQPRDVSPQNFRCVSRISNCHSYLSVARYVDISSAADIPTSVSMLGGYIWFAGRFSVSKFRWVVNYPLTAEFWFIPMLIQVWFYDWESEPRANFSQCKSVSPLSVIIPPLCHARLSSGACTIGPFRPQCLFQK
jgi:hypothetical protein